VRTPVIVNAADNKQRDPEMNLLEVVIDAETNIISVKNNGKGIPIEMHPVEQMYVPTMIFGHLLTGSNFDDDEKKTTGGRNGYGAKLANIFSTMFTVECVDTSRGKKFKQVFRDNMYNPGKAVVGDITAAEKKKGDYVKITFSPDLKLFKMDKLDDDTVGLLSRRAWDIAGTMSNSKGKKLVVTLNGKKLPVKSFQDYMKMYKDLNAPIAYERVDDNWEVGVAATTEHGTPQHISFVNGICTYKGGTHVAFVADKIAKELMKVVEKKNKGGTKISPGMIKNQLAIYVNSLVENPTFDSQTKDALTNKAKEFSNKCQLSDKFLKQAGKGQIVENILSFARYKQSRELNKTSGTKKLKVGRSLGLRAHTKITRTGKSHMFRYLLIHAIVHRSKALINWMTLIVPGRQSQKNALSF
jgi:DNA topoisomerase II